MKELDAGLVAIYVSPQAPAAFTAIPYAYWANRGESQMAVWVGV